MKIITRAMIITGVLFTIGIGLGFNATHNSVLEQRDELKIQLEQYENKYDKVSASEREKALKIEELEKELAKVEHELRLSESENTRLEEECETLKQQTQEEAVEEEPETSTAPAQQQETTESEYGIFIAEGNNYYHHYSDCPFIRNKKQTKVTADQIGDRHTCKCVYADTFWR